jgi:hypothetical protein
MDDPRPARPLVLHECTCQVLTKLNECRFGLSLYNVMNELHRHILPFFLIRSPWRRGTQVILPGSGCIGHQVTTVFFDISSSFCSVWPTKIKVKCMCLDQTPITHVCILHMSIGSFGKYRSTAIYKIDMKKGDILHDFSPSKSVTSIQNLYIPYKMT